MYNNTVVIIVKNVKADTFKGAAELAILSICAKVQEQKGVIEAEVERTDDGEIVTTYIYGSEL